MQIKRLAVVAVVLGAVVPFTQASPALASTSVKITKIHYAQTGTSLDTEYIVFANKSSSSVSMRGWKVISAPSSDNQRYVFPRFTLGAGKSVTLFTGRGSNTASKLYWNAGSARWNNDGDKAVLKNAGGTVVDTCQYAGGGTTAYC